MAHFTNNKNDFEIDLPSHVLYSIVWTVIFGTVLALGGSILEPFPVPFLNITAASFFVPLLITMNKLVLNKKFSVTAMYGVASCIAIFTTYLGPPTILKPLYIIAGFAFDLGTFFRTNRIQFWNFIVGHLFITIVGFFIFWIIYSIMIPGSSHLIAKAVMIAAPFHFGVSIFVSYVTFKVIPPNNPPQIVKNIRSQIIR